MRIYEGMLKETDSHLGFLAFYSNRKRRPLPAFANPAFFPRVVAVEGGQWQQTIPFLLRGVVYAAQVRVLCIGTARSIPPVCPENRRRT